MTFSQLRTVTHGAVTYSALMFWCPGCEHYRDGDPEPAGGLHMLPVNTDAKAPAWTWNGDLEKPTLAPSILTRMEHARRHADGELRDVGLFVCHSFLRDGVFEFLSDCTHQYAGQSVPMPPLPEWAAR